MSIAVLQGARGGAAALGGSAAFDAMEAEGVVYLVV